MKGDLLIYSFLQEIINETFPHLFVPTKISPASWLTISSSLALVLLIAHFSLLFFLRNLDQVGTTKARELSLIYLNDFTVLYRNIHYMKRIKQK